MSLPKIKIGIHEMDWHGVPCLKTSPDEHLVSLETLAMALDISVKDLCLAIAGRLQRLREMPPGVFHEWRIHYDKRTKRAEVRVEILTYHQSSLINEPEITEAEPK